MDTPTEFAIERVSIAGFYQRTLAEARVTVGPFNIKAEVSTTGDVDLPRSLRDPQLRHEIGVALRRAAVKQLIECMKLRNAEGEAEMARRTRKGSQS
jgi:hypothetical protein